jgi:hypothetical protein
MFIGKGSKEYLSQFLTTKIKKIRLITGQRSRLRFME